MVESGEKAEDRMTQMDDDLRLADVQPRLLSILVVADTEQDHPKGVTQGLHRDRCGTWRAWLCCVQGSLYVTDNEDMANLFPPSSRSVCVDEFPKSVRDTRAFRIEQWSDFTLVVKA